MSTSLELLSDGLFAPLTIAEQDAALGGRRAAGAFTYIGMCNIGGSLERDWEWDEGEVTIGPIVT